MKRKPSFEPPSVMTEEELQAAKARLMAMVGTRTAEPEPEAQETANPLTLDAILERLRSNLKSEAEADQWEWKNVTVPKLRECGFDERYLRRDLKLDGSQSTVLRNCEILCCGTGAIVALCGLRGTGKTSIVAQFARRRVEDGMRSPHLQMTSYRKMADLIAQFKSIYADHGTIEGEKLQATRDAFCRLPLVFIDEIHECDDSKLKSKILTDVLDRRYSALKDTILISNQTTEEFRSTIGASVLSRMSEHGRIIPCNWKSYR